MSTEQNGFSYTLTRTLDAPRGPGVWQAWTIPDQYAQWAYAVPGTVEMDVRPGGTWKAKMRTPEGAEFLSDRLYIEVAEHRALTTAWTSRPPGPGHDDRRTHRNRPPQHGHHPPPDLRHEGGTGRRGAGQQHAAGRVDGVSVGRGEGLTVPLRPRLAARAAPASRGVSTSQYRVHALLHRRASASGGGGSHVDGVTSMAHELLPLLRRVVEEAPDTVRVAGVQRVAALPAPRSSPRSPRRRRTGILASSPAIRASSSGPPTRRRSAHRAVPSNRACGSRRASRAPRRDHAPCPPNSASTPRSAFVDLVGLDREGGIRITAQLAPPVPMLGPHLPLPRHPGDGRRQGSSRPHRLRPQNRCCPRVHGEEGASNACATEGIPTEQSGRHRRRRPSQLMISARPSCAITASRSRHIWSASGVWSRPVGDLTDDPDRLLASVGAGGVSGKLLVGDVRVVLEPPRSARRCTPAVPRPRRQARRRGLRRRATR